MIPSRFVLGDSSYVLRRASRADIRGIVELLRDDRLGATRESTDWPRYEVAFADIARDPNQFLAVIEAVGGGLVGTMQLTLIPGLSRGGACRLQIEAVRIAASARGSGLGTAMIEWAHEYGRERGATLAQLTTDRTRADALRFYRTLGYSTSHEGLKRSL